jgi:hypothetical protein
MSVGERFEGAIRRSTQAERNAAARTCQEVGCRCRRRSRRRVGTGSETSGRLRDAASAAGGQSRATRLRTSEAPGEAGRRSEAGCMALAGVEESAAAPARHGHDVELAPAVGAVRPDRVVCRSRRRVCAQHERLPRMQGGEPAHRLEAGARLRTQVAEVGSTFWKPLGRTCWRKRRRNSVALSRMRRPRREPLFR